MLDNLFTPVHLIVLAFALGIYLLPTIISIRRRHPDRVLMNAQIAISLLPAQPAKEP